MDFELRPAHPGDARACVALRGKTRQNAVSEDQLRALGVTEASWSEDIRTGALPGHVCTVGGDIVAYCFGDRATGEVVVLAVLPDFENRGIGMALLQHTVHELASFGHSRLFLSCSPCESSRSHGFYRHLGWRSTGELDARGDEILEFEIKR